MRHLTTRRLRRQLPRDEGLVRVVRATYGGKLCLLAVTHRRLFLARWKGRWEEVPYAVIQSAQVYPRRFGALELRVYLPRGLLTVKGNADDLDALLSYLRARIWEARPRP